MKTIVVLILFIGVSYNSQAKKAHYSIELITGMADLIVVGKIFNVNGKTYSFITEETIKGNKTDTIQVNMFREWTCDIRSKEACKGQKLLLFLKKEGDNYTIINGSNGELFIDQNKVKWSRMYYNEKEYTVNQLTFALKQLLTCYKYIGSPTYFKQIRTDIDINNVSKSSELTKWLFYKIKRYKN